MPGPAGLPAPVGRRTGARGACRYPASCPVRLGCRLLDGRRTRRQGRRALPIGPRRRLEDSPAALRTKIGRPAETAGAAEEKTGAPPGRWGFRSLTLPRPDGRDPRLRTRQPLGPRRPPARRLPRGRRGPARRQARRPRATRRRAGPRTRKEKGVIFDLTFVTSKVTKLARPGGAA